MIRIENKITKTVPHFWDGIVFHPTDAIEDDWGRALLQRMAEDGAIRTVRIYAMFEDMVTLREDGRLRFDFTLSDLRIDTLLSLGFVPMVNYAFLPPWLSVHADQNAAVAKRATRYKGKMITNSYARDPAVFGEICRVFTEHLVARYGLTRIQTWYLQCYNEPDIKPFFMAEAGENTDPEAVKRRLSEYLKLYKAFADGVKSVDGSLRIGNSLAHSLPFLDGFLRDIRETDTPIDFVGTHSYGVSIRRLISGEQSFDAMSCIRKQRAFREIIRKHFDRDLPVVNDEWGACTSGFLNAEDCPQAILREKSAFAAYFGKMITFYAEEETRPEKVMICLSGQHEMTADFSGCRNFFTLHGIKKPIYNAHILASRLGDQMLAKSVPEENLCVYPTLKADGSLAILLSYAAEHFDRDLPDLSAEIDLSAFGTAFSGALWRIDKTHTDPYALFLRKEMRDPLNDEEIRMLSEEGELQKGPLPPEESGILRLTLSSESLTLIEITPKKEAPHAL